MLVYGDQARTAPPRDVLRTLTATLRQAEGAADGRTRHDILTSAFIQAGELAAGLADAEFAARGFDDITPLQQAAMALVLRLAKKLAASWGSSYVAAGPPVAPELMALALQALPDLVTLRQPEGYAFYAVYPEAYLKAAAGHPWGTPPLVIGLRSIGAGLAGLVAAVTSAAGLVTVRPHGEPFHRELKVSPALEAMLAAHAGPFAIVDEGPGLSGSSFGAAADLLQRLGVEAARIVFLPSHRGDLGARADPRHRQRWAEAARPVATFHDLIADDPLGDWFTDLIGPVSAIEELSGGAWRQDRPPHDWPPAAPAQERLKFRLHSGSGAWLARFAGLGALGQAKFERAQALHRQGFTPEPLALRRGFLLERWERGDANLGLRADFVDHLGAYLGFRAQAFVADPQTGASLPELAEMARANTEELLGPAAAQRVADALADLPQATVTPCHIDGRLHAWEWLRTPDGLLLKTDAIDHSQAHDLVGCQDIAWDIGGAAVEFDLNEAEIARICDAVAQACRRRPTPQLVTQFALCYAAFQAGLWRFGADAAPQEEGRIAAHARRYGAWLAQPAGALEG